MIRLELRPRIALTFILAFGVIAIALASEVIGGLQPCALCLKQRVPYYMALPLLAVAYLYTPRSAIGARGLLSTIGIVFLIGAGLGVYHAGIEYGSWAGPATCGGGGAMSVSTDALFEALNKGSMVRCDAPAWTLFGISLAGYNALASLALAIFAIGQKKSKSQ